MAAVVAMAERVKSGSLLSTPVRLEHFFHPETFLNALRQQMVGRCRLTRINPSRKRLGTNL
jgi:hypothetical protein